MVEDPSTALVTWLTKILATSRVVSVVKFVLEKFRLRCSYLPANACFHLVRRLVRRLSTEHSMLLLLVVTHVVLRTNFF